MDFGLLTVERTILANVNILRLHRYIDQFDENHLLILIMARDQSAMQELAFGITRQMI